jgi:DNA-binding MarR family transcriptional regulator
MHATVPQEQAAALIGSLQSLLRELSIGSTDPAVELPLAQLRVCRVLCSGPQSISAISRELGVSLSAVTQLGDRLERAKLVRRLAEDNDRRIRCLQLTARGERLLRLHDEERVRRMAAALGELTPQARQEAAAALDMLVLASAAARSRDGNGKSDGTGDGSLNSTSKVLL